MQMLGMFSLESIKEKIYLAGRYYAFQLTQYASSELETRQRRRTTVNHATGMEQRKMLRRCQFILYIFFMCGYCTELSLDFRRSVEHYIDNNVDICSHFLKHITILDQLEQKEFIAEYLTTEILNIKFPNLSAPLYAPKHPISANASLYKLQLNGARRTETRQVQQPQNGGS